MGIDERVEKAVEFFETNFDSKVGLVYQSGRAKRMAEGKEVALHDARASLHYAYWLLVQGTIDKAEAIINKVLEAQERREGHRYFGHCPWTYEDGVRLYMKEVEFEFFTIARIYKEFSSVLSETTKANVQEWLRNAFHAMDNMNISFNGDTNIVTFDIANYILGGEALSDSKHAGKGYAKLDAFIKFTVENGIHEYNSPGYSVIDLCSFAAIAMFSTNPKAVLQAKIIEERIFMHVLGHYHDITCLLAGPHGRPYRETRVGEPSSINNVFDELTGKPFPEHSFPYNHACPDYLKALITKKPYPYYHKETTDKDSGLDITTFLTKEYAIGSASKAYHQQANNFIIYYRRPKKTGVVYSKYVEDEMDSTTRFTLDWGLFSSVQHKNKVVALYGLREQRESDSGEAAVPSIGRTSLKTAITISRYDLINEIWVNEQRVKELPLFLKKSDVLFIKDGSVYIAIMSLEQTCLGAPDEAPLILDTYASSENNSEQNLVLSIYNFKGPSRPWPESAMTFWEYSKFVGPGSLEMFHGACSTSYWQGNIRAGFVAEVSDTTEYEDIADFKKHIYSSTITDETVERIREVTYCSGTDSISIKYDLFNDTLLERRINGELYEPPMLDATTMKQSRNGYAEVGNTTITTGEAPVWLLVDSNMKYYVVVNPNDTCIPLRWDTPQGLIETESFGLGKIVYRVERDAILEVDVIKQDAPIYVTKPAGSYRIVLNGREVTSQIKEVDRKGREMILLPLVN